MAIPELLYMYRADRPTLDRERQLLTDNLVYFARPSAFNDPFEVRPHIRWITNRSGPTADQIEAWVTNRMPNASASARWRATEAGLIAFGDPSKVKAYQQANMRDMLETFQNTTVACFAEDRHDIRMWSYYATKHQGYCVGFGFEKKWSYETSDAIVGIVPEKVHYKTLYPRVDAGLDLSDPKATDRWYQSALLTKASVWRHEKEWRCIRADAPSGLQKIPPTAVKVLIRGARMSKGRKRALHALLMARDHHVRLFDAVLEETAFRLRFEEVAV